MLAWLFMSSSDEKNLEIIIISETAAITARIRMMLKKLKGWTAMFAKAVLPDRSGMMSTARSRMQMADVIMSSGIFAFI
jgi:hypothetical protein